MTVIDTDNYEAAGIETLTFPAGEWHCNVPKIEHTFAEPAITIFAKLRNWDDVGKLLAVSSALQAQDHRVKLFCPYLPGARMDRSDGTTELGTRVSAEVLSAVSYDITAVDVHSQAAFDEFDRWADISVLSTSLWLPTLIRDKPDFIVEPDKGAHARALAAANLFGFIPIVTCEKTRDPLTGKLSGFKVPEHESFVGARYLIVDDICDGGGTFVGIHDAWLKVAPPEARLDLYVTHGIFSKGLAVLGQFDNVYTTDSYNQRSFEPGVRFFVEPLLPHYLRSQQA